MSLLDAFSKLGSSSSTQSSVSSSDNSSFFAKVDEEFGKGGFYSKKELSDKSKSDKHVNTGLIVIAVAFVIVAVLALYFAANYNLEYESFASSSSFEVKVLAASERVSNAFVSVYDEGSLIATGQTNSRGVASFEDLPQKELQFSVSAKGLGQTAVTSKVGDKNNAIVKFKSAPTSLKSIRVIVRNFVSKELISNAKFFYTVGNSKQQLIALTLRDGSANLELNGESIVKFRVVAPGFKMAFGTILATKPQSEVELEPKEQSVNESVFFEEQKTQSEMQVPLMVKITSENGLVQSGIARLLIPYTLELVAKSQVTEGKASFENLAPGNYLLEINSAGFYLYSKQLVVPLEQNELSVNLEEIPILFKETIFNYSLSGQSVALNVFLYTASNELISTYYLSSSSSREVNLSTKEQYKAVVLAQDALPLVIGEFKAGDVLEGELIVANEENSKSLTVNVVDDERSSISSVKVAIVNEDGFALFEVKESEFNTPMQFVVPQGKVTVIASINGFTARETFDVMQDLEVEMQLKTRSAFLKLNLEDLQTKTQPVGKVRLTSIKREGAKYDSCIYPCTLALFENEENKIEVTSENYAGLTFTIKAMQAKTTIEKSSKLVPLSTLKEQPEIELISIINSKGELIEGNTLRVGEKYELTFRAFAKNVDSISVFALSESEKAHFLEPLASYGFESAKSTVRLKQSSTCKDLDETSNVPPYKWILVTALNSSSAEFKIPMQVSQNGSLEVKFNAFTRRGELVFRNPKDEELKIFENTDKKAWCYADVKTLQFLAITPAMEQKSNADLLSEIPKVNGSGFITFDDKFKQIISDAQEYEMQVDSIFPADAFSIKLINSASCKMLLSIENSSVSSCFTHDSKEEVLKFATKEVNGNCPVSLKKDDFYLNENKVSRVSTTLKIAASCSNTYKNIPVNVRFINIPSAVVPNSEEQLGDGDSAKLIYLINNRQLYQRSFNVQSNEALKQFILAPASAIPISWRNSDGQLSISSEEITIADFFPLMQTTAIASTLKKGAGTISRKLDECTTLDCCAQNWCLSKHVSTQLELLEQKTRELAVKTAFRRGEDLPWKYFAKEPFAITTVTQASLGAQNAFKEANAQVKLPLSCNSKNPAVFQLSAELNNLNSPVKFKANALSLQAENYISASLPQNCDSTLKFAPKSQTAKNGSLVLCGFLQGQNNCVYSTNESTPLSLDQLDALRFEFINCVYPVFPGVPACPATRAFAIPAVNLGNIKATAELTDRNAFAKIWQAAINADEYDFSLFSFSNQIQCIVPPSFTQLALFTGANLLESTPQKAKLETQEKEKLRGIGTSEHANAFCSGDFFETFNTPLAENLLSLAGVCCANNLQATACTPRRGKMYFKVEENEVKVIANWGLTENCYPYFPLPLTPGALTNKGNIASIAVGMYEYYKSGGTNIEFTLSTEKPGFKKASEEVSSGVCSADSDCQAKKSVVANICVSYPFGTCRNGSCKYLNVEKKQLQEGENC